MAVEDERVDNETRVAVVAFQPHSEAEEAGVRIGDLITMVKVVDPYEVYDISSHQDFVRLFREHKDSKKTLMVFREFRDGVETLPEPIDWVDSNYQVEHVVP